MRKWLRVNPRLPSNFIMLFKFMQTMACKECLVFEGYTTLIYLTIPNRAITYYVMVITILGSITNTGYSLLDL